MGGKRVRIPTQKALMAKETSSSQAHRGQNDDSKKAVGAALANSKFNETVTTNKEPEKAQQIEASRRWNEVVLASPSLMQTESGSSDKKSWPYEVEDKLESQKKKSSIWDEFDITKISNA